MNKYSAYAQTDMSAMDQASLEARALIKSASALNEIKESWEAKQAELSAALDKNRLLWTVIAGEMREESNPQPADIKNNILNLALFIFQRTVDILAEPSPQKLDILITINMNIAKGLSEHRSETEIEKEAGKEAAAIAGVEPEPEPKQESNPEQEEAAEEEVIENPLE